MRQACLLFAFTLGAGALAACSFSSSGGPQGSATFDTGIQADFDAAGDAAEDVATPEAAGPDVTVIMEGGILDTSVPDVTVLESGAEAGVDTGVLETGIPEASLPDASPDAPPADAGVDASVGLEAGTDASAPEAGIDAAPAVDSSTACVTGVVGDFYIRPDGSLIYGAGGGHVLIVEAGSGAPLAPVTEVVQQQDHACGLRGSDGTVWCWPLQASFANANGDLGSGAFGGAPLPAGAATQVVTNASDAGAPSYLTGIQHLSTASDTFYTFPTCAIAADKVVWCWGFSTAEGSPPDGLFWGSTGSTASVPYAIPIAAGPAPADGGPPAYVHADQISVGLRHACVLSGGKVSCWGQNVAGNLGIGNANLAFQPYPVDVQTGFGLPSTVDAVGCGFDFTCALAGGSVWCWGSDSGNEIGNPSVPRSICNSNYCLPTPTPVQMSLPDGGSSQVDGGGPDQSQLTGITSMVIGYLFGCGLDTSGTIKCWGEQVGGVTFVPEAQEFTSASQPYTNITMITAWGEDWSALRYVTASGVYVSGNQSYVPYCQ
jgi:hypothetical protein